jgi:outer membrane receptor protein involved in Fe transport
VKLEIKKFFSSLVFIGCIFLNKSIAQNTIINNTTLDSITVVSRHLIIRDSSNPFIITTLQASNISTVDHRSLPEALIGSSGVFIQKTNHGGGSAFIRGLTGNQTLILVDGIRLNNSTFRYGPNQYLNTVDIFSIDKIEVAKGIGAVAYGSDALGGTILLQTKEQNYSIQPKWGFSNLSRFTSSNIEKTNRTEWGYSGNKIAWDGGISIKNYGDLLGGGNIGIQRPSGYNELDYNTKLKIKLDTQSNLVFSSQMTQQKNVPIYHKILLENYKINQTDLQSHSLNYLKYSKQYNQSWRKEVIITASYQQSIEQRSNQKNNSLTLRKEADTIKTISIIAELISKPNKIWTINTGFDYYQDKVNSIYIDINPLTNSTAFKRGLYPNDANYINSSLFNLHHFNLNKWNIQTGIRYNTVAINFKESTLGSVAVKTSSFVGDLSVSYQIAKKHLLYASVANGYRSPNIDDMGTLGIVDFRYEVPAYDLKPEKSLNSEFGYKYANKTIQINASAYYMQLKDIIARVKKDGVMIDGYAVYNKINIESAYIKGFEITIDKKLSKYLTWSSNTSYTYGQNLTKKEPMRRIPPMFGQNSLIWQNNKASLQITHQYAGAQNRLAQGDKDDNRIGKFGTPQWNVINIVHSYKMKHVNFQLGLLNILNEKYKTHGSGVFGMGRAISGSMLIHF